MNALGVGVVGLGDISNVYLDNIAKYTDIVEVVAVTTRRPEVAQRVAEARGIARWHETVKQLVVDPAIDIILNLTPPGLHTEVNRAAIDAGKHVYTEKPLAGAFAEGRMIMEAADAAGQLVGCAPDTFLGGRMQTMRRAIDMGCVGEVVGAGAFVVSHGHESFHPNPDYFYQPGAGPLHDIGPYYVTALLAVLGPVTQVTGMSSRSADTRLITGGSRRGERIDVQVDTHVTGTLRFENGAIATVIASFDVWDSELPRIEIWGTRGSLCVPDVDPLAGPNVFGGDVLLRTSDTYRWNDVPRPATLPGPEILPVEHGFTETSHARNSRGIGLVDLALAIRERRAPRADGRMALHALEVMDAIVESQGQAITMTTSFTLPEPLPTKFPTGDYA